MCLRDIPLHRAPHLRQIREKRAYSPSRLGLTVSVLDLGAIAFAQGHLRQMGIGAIPKTVLSCCSRS